MKFVLFFLLVTRELAVTGLEHEINDGSHTST